MSVPPGPRRVVTLPAGVFGHEAQAFAQIAASRGAHLLELRTDLQPADFDPTSLTTILPLLVSERTGHLPEPWRRLAVLEDRPIGHLRASEGPTLLISEHFEQPLSLDAALATWDGLPEGAHLKHVEPLGDPARFPDLLKLQAQLLARHGEGRVTVLVMGPLALPFRAVLAERNALDYLALTPAQASAPGQRLLADAVRADRAPKGSARLGILGTAISGSHSPRLHRPPFDRIDLPADAGVEAVVDALLPHYAGFAVTSPFKQRLARHLGAERRAINTLYRQGSRYRTANTDVDGAKAILERLGEGPIQVLGAGGAAAALEEAGGARIRIRRAAELPHTEVAEPSVWTWPDGVSPPEGLRFAPGTPVATIAYGAAGHRIARIIRDLGGSPQRLGLLWLLSQARRQRELFALADPQPLT